MSKSTTHSKPSSRYVQATSTACCAPVPGLYPKLLLLKYCSYPRLSTCAIACCTTLSTTTGMPSGLFFPGGLWNVDPSYRHGFICSCLALFPYFFPCFAKYPSTSAYVILSMPGAPLFLVTLSIASAILSGRNIHFILLSCIGWLLRISHTMCISPAVLRPLTAYVP